MMVCHDNPGVNGVGQKSTGTAVPPGLSPRARDAATRREWERGQQRERDAEHERELEERAFEMRGYLGRVLRDGDVIELRALGYGGGDEVRHGFFRKEDLDKLIAAALKIDSAEGVYFTTGVLKPGKFNHAAAEVKRAKKGKAASDTDVLRRRQLVLDTDPTREDGVAGICATEAEKARAWAVCQKARAFLDGRGFPAPWVRDSGNGFYLDYAVDLPADEESRSLVERFIKAMADLFDTADVKIDTSMANAARIARLPGTMNRKGDSTPDRPHRLCRVLEAPLHDVPVTPAQLEAVIALAQEAAGAEDSPGEEDGGADTPPPGGFDVEAFLEKHGVKVRSDGAWKGTGRRWVLDVCPFNPAHADGAAFVARKPCGTLAAGCHHNGCKVKPWGWKELRARLEGKETADRHECHDRPGGARRWEVPVPFPVFSPPPFPVSLLPGWLAAFVEGVAESRQVPVDLPAALALGVAGAGMARRVTVFARPDWWEQTNLYLAPALESGERKSATVKAVCDPVQKLEARRRCDLAPVIAEHEAERDALKAKLASLQRKFAEGKDGVTMALIKDAGREFKAFLVPAKPQLIYDDCTPGAMEVGLAEQGGRLLVASAEGTIFDRLSRFSEQHQADIDNLLKGHSNDDIISNRVTRGGGNIKNPAVSIAVSPQPCVLAELVANEYMRRKGLLARFLFSLPVSRVGDRDVNPRALPHTLRAAYDQRMTALWQLEPGKDEYGEDAPRAAWFTPAAHEVLLDFERWKEAGLRPTGILAGIKDWGNKAGGAVVRLAGILHGCGLDPGIAPWDAPIQAATVAAAAALVKDYFLPHALGVFGMHARGQVQADALKILGWIRAVKKQEFSRRDAQRALQSAFPKADDLDAPLAELVTRGYVAEEFGHRRDSRRYAVNPLALREPPLDTRDSRDTCPPTPPPPPPAGDPSDGHDTRDTPAGEEVIEV